MSKEKVFHPVVTAAVSCFRRLLRPKALAILLLFALTFGGALQTSASSTDLYAVLVSITSVVPNPVTVGAPTLVSVKVSAPGAPGAPTGVVEVKSGQLIVCQINLDAAGEGSCNLTFPVSGIIPLKAVYPGDTSFLPGVSQVVDLHVLDPDGNLTVYYHDFETSAGSEWCLLRQDRTPTGRGFLGQFGNQTTCLTLSALPAHTWLKFTFDLYLIRSWNGNVVNWNPSGGAPELPGAAGLAPEEIVGPDRWLLQADGSGLLNTTFANYDNFPQAYPGSYPGGDNPTGSGASERNNLGYYFYDDPMDSVYHLEFSFPHSASTLQLNFTAMGLQDLANESWGLDNLLVMVNQNPVFSNYLPCISR